ncbi:MAG: type II secretion system F family protein [Nitriliruptoraceae bacterium]
MVELAALAIAMSLPLAMWALVGVRPPAHTEVVGNLTRGLPHEAGQGTVRHRSGRLGGVVRGANPAGVARRIERLLSLAGRPPRWTVERVLVVKMLLSVALSAFGLVLVSDAPSAGRIVLWAMLTGLGYMVPEAVLHGRGVERQKVIQKEIPDTLDQMTISVEAGLGFDAAMSRAASNGSGPLAEELVRTLQDIQVGVPRRDAYRGLADRTTVTDLRRFVAALLQADAYGIPLVDILRTQAQEIRLKRRQRAEHDAMQIPVKVVFPLVLLILPTLFIVLMGPAAMDIVAAFGGMN